MNPPRNGWRDRLAHLRSDPSARMRATGRLVLAGGVVVAVIVYLVARNSIGPAPFDPLEGNSRSADRQMGALMGNWVKLTSGWTEAVASPAGKAAGVLVLSALVAFYFFRVASVVDAEGHERVNDRLSGTAPE